MPPPRRSNSSATRTSSSQPSSHPSGGDRAASSNTAGASTPASRLPTLEPLPMLAHRTPSQPHNDPPRRLTRSSYRAAAQTLVHTPASSSSAGTSNHADESCRKQRQADVGPQPCDPEAAELALANLRKVSGEGAKAIEEYLEPAVDGGHFATHIRIGLIQLSKEPSPGSENAQTCERIYCVVCKMFIQSNKKNGKRHPETQKHRKELKEICGTAFKLKLLLLAKCPDPGCVRLHRPDEPHMVRPKLAFKTLENSRQSHSVKLKKAKKDNSNRGTNRKSASSAQGVAANHSGSLTIIIPSKYSARRKIHPAANDCEGPSRSQLRNHPVEVAFSMSQPVPLIGKRQFVDEAGGPSTSKRRRMTNPVPSPASTAGPITPSAPAALPIATHPPYSAGPMSGLLFEHNEIDEYLAQMQPSSVAAYSAPSVGNEWHAMEYSGGRYTEYNLGSSYSCGRSYQDALAPFHVSDISSTTYGGRNLSVSYMESHCRYTVPSVSPFEQELELDEFLHAERFF